MKKVIGTLSFSSLMATISLGAIFYVAHITVLNNETLADLRPRVHYIEQNLQNMTTTIQTHIMQEQKNQKP